MARPWPWISPARNCRKLSRGNYANGNKRKAACMSDEPVIRTKGLTRYFGSRRAVYELNLEVPQGCVFAFLGRNGSGKTTTIRMLLGLLQPTRGEGTILGHDIRAIPPAAKARIGYLTEEHQIYGWMDVRQSAAFQSQFYAKWKEKVFQGVIDHFGLKPNARVKDLSRGERAGLCLALTLAPDPDLLILDDPALGLDPVARRSLIESMIYLTRRSIGPSSFPRTTSRMWSAWRITSQYWTTAFCGRRVRSRHSVKVCSRCGSDLQARRRSFRNFPDCSRPLRRSMNAACLRSLRRNHRGCPALPRALSKWSSWC